MILHCYNRCGCNYIENMVRSIKIDNTSHLEISNLKKFSEKNYRMRETEWHKKIASALLRGLIFKQKRF